MRHFSCHDVHWHAPKRKRPIAYSTEATNDLIVMLAKEHNTIQDVHDALNYDVDAKAVLQEYITRGFGNEIARQWFR